MSNLYHIILLYPVEPCAPSCTLSPCTNLYRLAFLTLPLSAFLCLCSRSFYSLWWLPVAHSPLYLSPIRLHLALVAPSCHPQIHHRYNMHTAIPFRIWSHCRLSHGLSVTPLSVLSHPYSSCLTPQHTHPFTCNPYIVTIIDLHPKAPCLHCGAHITKSWTPLTLSCSFCVRFVVVLFIPYQASRGVGKSEVNTAVIIVVIVYLQYLENGKKEVLWNTMISCAQARWPR